jgi:hypothetical protein
MGEIDNNRQVKAELCDFLKKSLIEEGGVQRALLTRHTEQIIINCNNGDVTDIKPMSRFK